MEKITPKNCQQVLADYKTKFKSPVNNDCETDVLLQYLQQHGMDTTGILGCGKSKKTDNTAFLVRIITFLDGRLK